MHKQGWTMVEDAGRGWRKVVPSPRPLEVVQREPIRRAVEAGNIVIAGGGGGIPVYRTREGEMRGVEAVIDKDYTASLIASDLKADLFVILTGVDQVSINFGKPDQKAIRAMDVAQARMHQADGQFPEGSMGPKIRAAIEFVETTGREVLITSSARLLEAVRGKAGTRIIPPGRGRRKEAGRRRAAAPGRNA
jgi:carbamate kinase